MTILLTTHYMDEAYQICDTILIMDKGRKAMEKQTGNLELPGVTKIEGIILCQAPDTIFSARRANSCILIASSLPVKLPIRT